MATSFSFQKSNGLVLNPRFQRRAVWKPGAKSLLIDTVYRGLPIPIIFLREQRTDVTTLEPKREVVDGQQRIRTLLAYIAPTLLRDYKPERDDFVVDGDHNADLAGRRFSDLTKEAKQRILEYQFSVHVLPAGVGDREVLQIFARMNSTGVKLNAQELRNSEWFGRFKTSMYKLALEQLDRWTDWKIFSDDNIARMDEVELVSEFALLALKGLTSKSQSSLDRIYEDNDAAYPERREFARRFNAVMDTIDDHFGAEMHKLPFHKRTLFYSLFALMYDQMFGLGSRLKTVRPSPPSAQSVQWVREAAARIQQGRAPQRVLDANARRTTHLSSRRVILRYLRRVK